MTHANVGLCVWLDVLSLSLTGGRVFESAGTNAGDGKQPSLEAWMGDLRTLQALLDARATTAAEALTRTSAADGNISCTDT